MHIALVTYEFPPVTAIGGIGSYMLHLTVLLTRMGHKVTVFSADPGAKEPLKIEREHCINFLIPSQDNESFRKAVVPVFAEFVRANPVDLIESPEVGACAWDLKENYPEIPLIVKMHTPGVLITKVSNTYLPLKTKLRYVAGALKRGRLDLGYWARRDKNRDTDLEYRLCMKADTLLSPSIALKQWVSDFWDIPSEKIQVIPNPFSPGDDLFQFPLQNRQPVISFVGKLSILKGMRALTEAIPLILERNKGCKIFLVGRDETENGASMQGYMQARLGEYNARVIFTGALKRGELNSIYAQSRVCVFPSLWENYPTVILEAMAAGAAVAAANSGGIPEIVQHQQTGVLFHPKKPKQIATAVNWLLQNEKERIALAVHARERLHCTMTSGKFETKLKTLYTKTADNRTSLLFKSVT